MSEREQKIQAVNNCPYAKDCQFAKFLAERGAFVQRDETMVVDCQKEVDECGRNPNNKDYWIPLGSGPSSYDELKRARELSPYLTSRARKKASNP